MIGCYVMICYFLYSYFTFSILLQLNKRFWMQNRCEGKNSWREIQNKQVKQLFYIFMFPECNAFPYYHYQNMSMPGICLVKVVAFPFFNGHLWSTMFVVFSIILLKVSYFHFCFIKSPTFLAFRRMWYNVVMACAE